MKHAFVDHHSGIDSPSTAWMPGEDLGPGVCRVLLEVVHRSGLFFFFGRLRGRPGRPCFSWRGFPWVIWTKKALVVLPVSFS